MSTIIRSELSKKNKYYISKHRYLELKHFCLQYYEFKKAYNEILCLSEHGNGCFCGGISDKTAKIGLKKVDYANRIKIIEDACDESDPFLSSYIFKAVTYGYGFTYLKTVMDIPCGKDYYYARYRRFFWILDKKRG